MQGTVPMMGANQQKQNTTPATPPEFAGRKSENDEFLCHDALDTEKHVSSLYDTCIFEFTDAGARDALNHIQKEEQEHGKRLYDYMSAHNMCA